jgi:hypothetical protein
VSEPQPQCSATTQAGKQCRKRAVIGSDKCAFHLGKRIGVESPLNEELIDRLTAVIRAGSYIYVACAAVGISRRTYTKWMQRGLSDKPGDVLFRLLRTKVEVAQAEGEVRRVATIAAAANENWQAAAWLLERQYPERWARMSQREQPPGQPSAEPQPDDPFSEVDELAEARRRRRGS